jgi:hypothetical protein
MNANFTKQEREELEQCKKTLVISWKSRRNGRIPRIDESFFNWCQDKHQPYIQVTFKRAIANIAMELPNDPRLLDKEGAEQFQALCSEFGIQPQFPRNPAVEGLPREVATAFVKRLVKIGTEYCERAEHN